MPRSIRGCDNCTMATATRTLPNADPARASIGLELERVRLEHRARRMRFAIGALRELADSRAADGAAPPALQQAIARFSQELAQVRRRMNEL